MAIPGSAARRAAPRGIIGMVHLLPLPGAPRWGGSMEAVVERALADARHLAAGPVDALLVENFGDLPFYAGPVPPETVAAMTAVITRLRAEVDRPMGVNVLRNDAASALAIAAATAADFIRVNVHSGGMYTDQGWIQGDAARTLRLRARLAPTVAILADVMVKHATPVPGSRLADVATDTWERGLADALIVSGRATGSPTPLDDVRAVREAVPGATIIVGSGVTAESAREVLGLADGAIVGSAFQEGGVAGAPVDPARVRRFFSSARG